MSETRTFTCAFAGGVSVTMAFNVADYLKAGGDYAGNRLKWTGRPTQQMRQQFVAWIHTVNGQIADLINDKYFYALQFGTPEPEFWIYHPGGKREQVYD